MAAQELAIFSGVPFFCEPRHVGRPNIPDRNRLFTRISAALDAGRLTNDGPLVREFEQAIARHLGVPYCVAFCNGTIAMEILLRALEVRGEVILPSFTFVSAAHSLLSQGIKPVFCDIDPATHCLDPHRLAGLITPETSAILGVHLWGNACAVEEIQRVAEHHGLRFLLDAAHAFGCSHGGRMIGGFGTAEVFSFHATKFVNSVEGGAVTTRDSSLAARLRLLRNFGFAGYDEVVCAGTNGKMTEFSAAMGLTCLEEAGRFAEENRRRYNLYCGLLEGLPGIHLLNYPAEESHNFQYVVLEVTEASALSRDGILAVLHAENILARRYFSPGVHRMEPYKTLYPGVANRLLATERLSGQVLVLPSGGDLSPEDVRDICRILRTALLEAESIGRQLSRL